MHFCWIWQALPTDRTHGDRPVVNDASTRARSSPEPMPPVGRPGRRRQTTRCRAGRGASLAIFFAMNLLDSVDQWLLAAVLPAVSDELSLSEAQAGWLSTVLLLGLAAASLPVGYLADRLRRPRLLADGFRDLERGDGRHRTGSNLRPDSDRPRAGGRRRRDLRGRRADDPDGLVPSSDPRRVLAVFFLAVPLGAALGLSRRRSFCSCDNLADGFSGGGCAGIVPGPSCPDAARSPSAARVRVSTSSGCGLHEHVGPSREDYVDLMVNSSYTYSVFGITFSSFALAGLVYWSPTFLTVAKGLTEAQADAPLGLTLLGAAILGTVAGGWLADWSTRTKAAGALRRARSGMLAAIPFVLGGDLRAKPSLIFGGLFLAEGVMFMNIVPVLHDHRQRGDAQHARRGLRRGPGFHPSAGRHLVADLDGLGRRHVR